MESIFAGKLPRYGAPSVAGIARLPEMLGAIQDVVTVGRVNNERRIEVLC